MQHFVAHRCRPLCALSERQRGAAEKIQASWPPITIEQHDVIERLWGCEPHECAMVLQWLVLAHR